MSTFFSPWANTRNRYLLLVGGLSALTVLLCLGCGKRGARARKKEPASVRTPTTATASAARDVRQQCAGKTPGLRAKQEKYREIFRKQEAEERVSTRLEDAWNMLHRSNLEGALRSVKRLQLEHRKDPHVEMRAEYLKAMIYHRMGNARLRKKAMDAMLHNMETLQKDPRFLTAFEEGVAAQELIKMSLKEAGNRYGKE